MKWADPPRAETHNTRRAYETEAKELRANPGRWGVITSIPVPPERETGKTNEGRRIAYYIKSGKYLVFRPKGAFDAKSRMEVENGREVVNVYAQYIGDK